MARTIFGRSLVIVMLGTVFAAGFFCGSVSQRRADAQMQGLGETLMKGAAGSGGMLGAAGELGTSVVEMQQHVNGLQKNLDSLKKIQSALTGK